MDPALNHILAPWAQFGILGSVVLALGATVWMQWRHILAQHAAFVAELKACGERYAGLLERKVESDNHLANALERLSERVRT